MIGFFPKYHAGVVTMWNAAGPIPAGLMPMVFDSLLGLPHVDWAGVEGSARTAPVAKAAKAPAKSRAKAAAKTPAKKSTAKPARKKKPD
jgi:beta-lactamase class C